MFHHDVAWLARQGDGSSDDGGDAMDEDDDDYDGGGGSGTIDCMSCESVIEGLMCLTHGRFRLLSFPPAVELKYGLW